MPDYYAYLKLAQFDDETSIDVDTFPLRVVSANFSVDKTIPNIPVPLSGLFTGESVTAALDLGMSNKRVSLSGFILPMELKRSHSGSTAINFTAHEVAQMIASGVDSTGLARYQAIDELVILMPSTVDEDYNEVAERNIPFTFHARGAALSLDNKNVVLPFSFPTTADVSVGKYKGLRGFISSFGFTFSGETLEVEFTLDFTIASVLGWFYGVFYFCRKTTLAGISSYV